VPLFSWKQEYSVGVDTLDEHHKALIRIINKLYDECLFSSRIDCAADKIADLLSYTQYHFQAEEQYMQEIQFFDVDQHREKHEAFTFKIRELQQIDHVSDLALTKELIVFLGKWLLHHVFEEDRHYALHAAGRGATTTEGEGGDDGNIA
jgi:hemerythrin